MSELMDKLQSVLNDEESMKQVKELADMLSGGEGKGTASQPENAPSAPPVDPMLLMKIQGIMSQAAKQKLDRIVKLFRLVSLYPAIKESGILGGDLLGIL